MRGAALRAVAELLGHQSPKMTMRYAHLSPGFLAAEVSLLDEPTVASVSDRHTTHPMTNGAERWRSQRARKGQRARQIDQRRSQVPGSV
jgi:hypothetical protein